MELVDLHTHTRASDGTDSPAQLMAKAAEAGLRAIAVTDHDTLSGLDEAAAAGRELGVELIRGCEISTSTELGELHILGLWLPEQPEALLQNLAFLREKRGERNEGIVRKLQDLGLDVGMEEVLAAAKGESVGRPHIAEVLLRKGYAKNIREVFKEFLGNHGKAYLPKEVLEPEAIVRLLADLGATVSLAHPLLWKAPPGWLEGQVARLRDCGLNAIEAWHSEHTEADVRTCLALAKRFDLGISGGSDYHGINKPAIQLGRGYGGLRVGVGVLDDLRERRIKMGLPV
ncbi:PHP domain-containing protein [Desulfovibrio sp. 1188_IL3213]|uniref:PHP domain-containing protein n=2 Tax=unclassified Desulfovibrio TaxID=2593640 RepID=UPI002FD92D42